MFLFVQNDIVHSPKNSTVAHAYNQYSHSVMPAEAHGDEHDVVVLFQIPRWSTQRIQYKPDLKHNEYFHIVI